MLEFRFKKALSIAIDWEEGYGRIFKHKGGVAAHGPVPPGLFGSREGQPGFYNPVTHHLVDGKPVPEAEKARVWRYHKPAGLLTSHKDPAGRPTVFDALPAGLPRVISVGRLDLNSEGLLLLTNDGALARKLELPSQGWLRRYRVRVLPAPCTRLTTTAAM